MGWLLSVSAFIFIQRLLALIRWLIHGKLNNFFVIKTENRCVANYNGDLRCFDDSPVMNLLSFVVIFEFQLNDTMRWARALAPIAPCARKKSNSLTHITAQTEPLECRMDIGYLSYFNSGFDLCGAHWTRLWLNKLHFYAFEGNK